MFASQNRIKNQVKHLLDVFRKSEAAIRPHFFLTGPSGSGKTYIVSALCEELDIPMFEINAAQLTAEGISGNSISKALRPLREIWDKPNVIFVDEFDKLFQRNGESTEGFRSQVQDEFLHMLESKVTSVFGEYGKYDQVRVDNTMFIFAGAFQGQDIKTLFDLQKAGMRPEFIGRVPLVFSTEPATLEELYEALPRIELFLEYCKLYPKTNKKAAAAAICEIIKEQSKKLGIGIRMLNSATHQYFMKDIK